MKRQPCRLSCETRGGAADEPRARVRGPLQPRCTIGVAPRVELRIAEHRCGSDDSGRKWTEQDGCDECRQEVRSTAFSSGQATLRDCETDADSFRDGRARARAQTVTGASSV